MSADTKQDKLEQIVGDVQRRWGRNALQRLGDAPPPPEIPTIPTGYPELDRALGIGGIPRGHLTEFIGQPTCGLSTIALRTAASVQAAGDTVAVVDISHAFDVEYAASCGVRTDQLLIIRPHTIVEAFAMAEDLIATNEVGLLLFDSVTHVLQEPDGSRVLGAGLRRLPGVLADSPCAALFLTRLSLDGITAIPNQEALARAAHVRLMIGREGWIVRRRKAIVGCRASVFVLKNKVAEGGKEVTIEVLFGGGEDL